MATYQVVDPRTDNVVETFPSTSWASAERILDSAHNAFLTWRRSTVAERADTLRAVAALLRENKQELAAHASLEMGKASGAAEGEIGVVADIFEYYAVEGPAMLRPHALSPKSGGSAEIVKAPVGIVLGVMPWNYPYYQLARLIAPNLLLGNAVVVKPAPACPRSAAALEAVLLEAGVPAGVYSTVLLENDDIEKAIADARVQGVSFTGSERVGKIIGQTAGRHLKKAVLELGGSDPLIVLDTADAAAAARTAYSARLANMGQACNSPKRMIVASEAYDTFVAELVTQAKMHGAEQNLAPLASRVAAEGVHSQIRRAVEQGASLLVGGDLSEVGAFVTPAVITNVTPDMDIFSEEVFGPVVVVYETDSEQSAIELANRSPYGLGAAVFTSDPASAERVAAQLEVGMVFLNCVEDSEPDLPFGGVKTSGYGRELGELGILEFCNHKLVRRA